MKQDVCERFSVDEDKVSSLKPIIQEEDFDYPAQLFKALSDPTRLKIAYSLMLKQELCVCDVASVINSTVATASHHLRMLKNLGLAKYRKEGKLVYYSLDDEHIEQLIQLVFDHAKEGKCSERTDK
ncbi:ArsR/SmtB family transcription factor [Hazenella coriacea]|uniref:Cadmium-sensing regulator CadC n=1 Tax=Hazenella coriacea TaxID=1179467 RepID=A0A4R3L2L9_9BACL|nr:metalloregulator ArsR/SmtB family transcription factor [Hazenella coriacea]TCS93891.1 cadmium-sensing regulator CadC [Hazenella coriacea]